MRAREDLLVVVQVLGHRDEMVLDVREIESDVARRCDLPIFVAPFCESLDDVRLVAHQSKQAHDLLSTAPDAAQHVALLGLLEDEHELVDAVHFVLDALDERTERVGDVVDEGIGYPVGRDADVVLELLYAPSNILWVGRGAEVKLRKRRRSVESGHPRGELLLQRESLRGKR